MKQRLATVERGQAFVYNGVVYEHDPDGRDGNGKIAVREADTHKPTNLRASLAVEVIRGYRANSVVIDEDTEVFPASLTAELAKGFGDPVGIDPQVPEVELPPYTVDDLDNEQQE